MSGYGLNKNSLFHEQLARCKKTYLFVQNIKKKPRGGERQQKGSKSCWSSREDHAQHRWGPESSRRELYMPHIIDSILLYVASAYQEMRERRTQATSRHKHEAVHRRAYCEDWKSLSNRIDCDAGRSRLSACP
ncbi:unnamed protein product [Trichogramma brassicae]|uniref:Uncharacterized protein n=1 Tax=Trichogramma brassicae TaxID=86971 RepID=A0A6H5HWL5_9HYME|nr:unnamed protein product [Trichogramma brassicae]